MQHYCENPGVSRPGLTAPPAPPCPPWWPVCDSQHPGLTGHPTGQPSTCSVSAFGLSSGKPESKATPSLRGGCMAGMGDRITAHLSSSRSTLCRRRPTTPAASTGSSETGRFPVVSAPLPSATLYCKQRATLNKALWCPVSGQGGGGRLLRFSRGKPSLDSVSSLSPVLKSSV